MQAMNRANIYQQ